MSQRLTPQLIESKIKSIDYHVFPGSLLTVCGIVLHSGYTCIGTSSCVYPEDFNKEKGETQALANAKNEIWSGASYALKEELFEGSKDV